MSNNNTPSRAKCAECGDTGFVTIKGPAGPYTDSCPLCFGSGSPDAANAGEPTARVIEIDYESRKVLVRFAEAIPEWLEIGPIALGVAADESTRAPTDAAHLTDAQILAGLTAARQRACDFDYDDGTTAAQREAAQAAAFREGAGLTGAPAEPLGWLYDWTHSSALGKPDEHFTSFTTDEAHARKHDNPRPVWGAPDAAPPSGERTSAPAPEGSQQ